ncbi:kinase-like protein, partial [Macrolepiota fuliginosa MF-IS2]
RRSILMALLRLAAAHGQYPQQLRLDDIQYEPSALTAGRFGEVYKGQYEGQKICLKIFKLYERSQVDHLNKKFLREAIIWSDLYHPNVLPFSGAYHVSDPRPRIGLVSPWMDNGNLSEYLKSHPGERRLPFVRPGCSIWPPYLHQNEVVHGDLKGVNILVDVNGSARLADFGLSSVIDADILRWTSLETMTRAGGTTRWVAPEMADDPKGGGLSRPNFASDIYSLASIFTGRIPFHEIPNDIAVLYSVMRGVRQIRPTHEVAPELTDHIWEMMKECWSVAPSDRPIVGQVVKQFSVIVPFSSRQQTAEAEPWINLTARRTSTRLSEWDKVFLVNAVSPTGIFRIQRLILFRV